MGKVRKNCIKKKGRIVKLKIVVEKIQKSLLVLGNRKSSSCYDEYEIEEACDSGYVPEDVKEGHFAVIAEDGEEPKRFVVPLSCLTHPTFLRLLEQSAEEYGFDQEGALTIPCRPSELEMILAEQWQQEGDSESWVSCKAMVQSY
ncbi:hypothetical protein L6164_019053 [Bauhinia variegata]|uniref:Uncharacterized protein n=1 Tax=Bauhinia variegata TaxID=167791 RepID=A0ACB9NGL8_BAUVA|nr:hypothetical protein L6164_019053 [Bauhinia variegata]